MNQHWGIPSTNSSTSTTNNTTDLISTSAAIKEEPQSISGEGSNVAGGQLGDTQELNMAAVKSESSPASGGTVSAAADSSDNQPPTPTPNENSAYNNQMYPPTGEQHPAYHHPAYTYDQSYHYSSPSAGDYSNVMQQQSQQQQQQQQMYGGGEFKPSARFHPYMANNTSNTSSSISTSGSISPRVVSSSSPAMMGQNQNGQQSNPAPEIKCEKCGYVCTSDIQLNEHYSTAHTADGVIKEEGNSNSQFSFAPYALKQDEPPQSDILDLDSQKMVYPPDPNDPTLPQMHSIHPMHRPMMGQQWGHNGQPHDMHYMQHQPPTTPSDPHKSFFPSMKQSPQQSPYPPTGMTKTEFSPMGTPPYVMPPQTPQQKQPYPQNDSVSSSPSEYPSTTTQDGGQPGFVSSLPKSSTTWKSNEARRPKTYNCTACNKWFTSSGHLKRHYNTTLHKNAVKSSNQPDPATLPISVHHHPDRDPNSKHSRPRNHRPPVPPPDPARSPEYAGQYAGQSPSYQQSQQQNYSNFPQQNLNGHPNGVAGPSVHPNNPSHPRGLLNNLTSEVQQPQTTTQSSLPVDQQMEQEVHTTSIKREDSYSQLHQTELDVDSSNNSSHSSNHSLEHHPQLHQPHQHLLQSSQQQQQSVVSQHQQQHQQLPQQPDQQQPPVHIISHHIFHTNTPQHLSPREDTIHTTQHNIMDQQQYIISPLGINPTTPTPITQHTGEVHQSGDITTTTNTLQQHNITTTVAPTPIPSFQHLQLPVEHQVNYPTHIIGNGNDLDSFDNDSNHSNSNTPIHLHDTHTQNHNTIFSHNSDQNLLQLGTAATSLGSPTTTYIIRNVPSPSEHSSSASISPVPGYHNEHILQNHSQHQTLFQPITLIENHHDDQQQMTHTIISNSHQLHQQHQQQHHTITNTDGHILQIIPSTTPPMQLHQLDQQDHLTSFHNNIHQTNYMQHSSLQQQQQEFMDLQRMSGGVPTYREKLTQPYSPVVPESDNSLLLRISPFSNQRSPQEADMPPATYTITNAQQQQSHTQYPYSPTISSTQTAVSATAQTPSSVAKKRAPKRKREASSNMEGSKIVCIECDKEFSKICYLTQHNKTFHNGEQPFRCQKCGKRFPNEELYDTHLERHVSQDKPFKCDLCPKQFHHKTDLRRHKEAIHTGLKAHVCDLCNKSFCRKDHLRKHIETHTRAKPVRRMKNANALASTNNNNNFIVINNNRSGQVGLSGAGNTMTQQTISSMFLKNDLGMKEEFEEMEEFICDDEEILG